jgi:hypothetical protein
VLQACKNRSVLEFSCFVRRRPEVTVRNTPTGALLIDLTTGRCWQLNRIGADFLSQIETEKALGDAYEILQGRYKVAPHVLRRDVQRLAQELLDAGLVDRVSR